MQIVSTRLQALQAAIFGPSDSFSNPTGWFVRALGGGKSKAGPVVNEFVAPYLPVVYACWNRISNPVARFPMSIRKPKKGGGSEEVTDHPMSRSINLRPNPYMSSRTLRKTGQSHALGWGNGYLEIERNNRGQGVGLWPLLPDRTRPVRRAQDRPIEYETTIGGKQFWLPHDNVIHIMDLSHDGYIGMSPIQLAKQAIGLGLAMEEFGSKFFANDAKSGGFLLHPGKLTGAAKENIRGTREKGGEGERNNAGADLDRQGGLDNAHRVKVLEEGMKFVSTTIPPEDAQFLGSREFQIAEIARIYDVPLVLLQSHEKSTSWGSGIEQLMIGFLRSTIEPWVSAWEQELNWKLFTQEEREQGYYVKFNMNAMMRGDTKSRAAFYREMFGVSAFSANRILDLEDEEPIGPEGDERFVSTGYQSLRTALNPPAQPGSPSTDDLESDEDDNQEEETA